MGPAWESSPEKLRNGRIVYRCTYGHMHSDDSTAWACGGPAEKTPDRNGENR